MEMQNNPYGWEAKAFAFDAAGRNLEGEQYTQEELAAILFYRKLYNRVQRIGKTLIIQIDGEHQTGKSTSGAFLLAYTLDATFESNRLKRVVYTAKELLDAVDDIRIKGIKGACIIVDEAGSAVNKQDYYEEFAKAINKSLQVAGYLHFIIIFVSPIRDQIMGSLEKMAHKYIHMERGNNDFTVMRPYDLKYNSIKKKQFPPRPKISIYGNKYILRSIKIKKLPKWLDDEYREIEQGRKPHILEKIKEQGLQSEIREKRRDPEELIPLVIENPAPYLAKSSNRIRIRLEPVRLARKLSISHRDALYIQAEAESRLNTTELLDARKKQVEAEETKKEENNANGD